MLFIVTFYLIKSAISTLNQLSRDLCLSLSIVNFSFTILHRRQITDECNFNTHI